MDDKALYTKNKTIKHGFTKSSERLIWMYFVVYLCTAFISLTYKKDDMVIAFPYITILPLVLLYLIYSKSNNGLFVIKKETLFLLFILLTQILSSTFSRQPLLAYADSLYILYFMFSYFVFKYLLEMRILDGWRLITVAKFIFFILVIIALMQKITNSPIGLPANYLGDSNLENVTYGGVFRVSGTLISPNVFAIVIQFLSIFVCVGILSKSNYGIQYVKVIVVAVITVFVVSTTLSRSGMAFSILSFMMLYLSWLKHAKNIKNKRLTVLGVLVLFGFVGLLSNELALLLSGSARISDVGIALSEGQSRIEMVYAALHMLSDRKIFIFGVGENQFFRELWYRGEFLNYLSWLDYRHVNTSVHNWILQVWSENGIFMLVGWFVLFTRFIYAGKSYKGSRYYLLVKTIPMQLLVLLMTALQLDTSFKSPPVLTLISLAGAYLVYESQNNTQLEKKYDNKRSPCR